MSQRQTADERKKHKHPKEARVPEFFARFARSEIFRGQRPFHCLVGILKTKQQTTHHDHLSNSTTENYLTLSPHVTMSSSTTTSCSTTTSTPVATRGVKRRSDVLMALDQFESENRSNLALSKPRVAVSPAALPPGSVLDSLAAPSATTLTPASRLSPTHQFLVARCREILSAAQSLVLDIPGWRYPRAMVAHPLCATVNALLGRVKDAANDKYCYNVRRLADVVVVKIMSNCSEHGDAQSAMEVLGFAKQFLHLLEWEEPHADAKVMNTACELLFRVSLAVLCACVPEALPRDCKMPEYSEHAAAMVLGHLNTVWFGVAFGPLFTAGATRETALSTYHRLTGIVHDLHQVCSAQNPEASRLAYVANVAAIADTISKHATNVLRGGPSPELVTTCLFQASGFLQFPTTVPLKLKRICVHAVLSAVATFVATAVEAYTVPSLTTSTPASSVADTKTPSAAAFDTSEAAEALASIGDSVPSSPTTAAAATPAETAAAAVATDSTETEQVSCTESDTEDDDDDKGDGGVEERSSAECKALVERILRAIPRTIPRNWHVHAGQFVNIVYRQQLIADHKLQAKLDRYWQAKYGTENRDCCVVRLTSICRQPDALSGRALVAVQWAVPPDVPGIGGREFYRRTWEPLETIVANPTLDDTVRRDLKLPDSFCF